MNNNDGTVEACIAGLNCSHATYHNIDIDLKFHGLLVQSVGIYLFTLILQNKETSCHL